MPGDIIVITDSLVEISTSTDEVVAVLAHEVGHGELRHPMKGLLEGSIAAVLAAAVTHDAATAGGAVAAAPFVLLNLKYSRDLESQADQYGFELLKRRGFSPLAFKSIIEALTRSSGNQYYNSFLSDHPSPKDREREAFLAATSFDQPVLAPDSLMYPAIRFGERVRVIASASWHQRLKRGDVVAYYTDATGFSLGRILAMPFDVVSEKDGAIVIDGTQVARNRLTRAECQKLLTDVYGSWSVSDGNVIDCHYEISGSSRYLVLMDQNSLGALEARTLPRDQILVSGDNRVLRQPNTLKAFYYIPESAVLGVVDEHARETAR